ncbi:hypothetical protein [Paraliobacillus sediminis]|nr:hypothetical protein [Paraliobacillus sediminis]
MGETPVGTAQVEDPLGEVLFFTNESFRLCPRKANPFTDVVGKKFTSQYS